MNSKTTIAGLKVLAELIAGYPSNINTMYVEYGPYEAAPGSGSIQYFRSLQDSTNRGFARIPITGREVSDDGTITFTATINPEDLIGAEPTSDTVLLSSALAHSPDGNMDHDIIVVVGDMPNRVPVTKSTFLSVKDSIRIQA